MNYFNNPNGYFIPAVSPVQYGAPIQQQFPQMYQQPNVQESPQDGIGFVWVQGKEGAKAYPVAPNKTVLLLDSEDAFVYKKSADKDGKPTEFKTFKLVEQSDEGTSSEAEYITRDEFEKIDNEIEEIKEMLLDIQTTPDPVSKRKKVN